MNIEQSKTDFTTGDTVVLADGTDNHIYTVVEVWVKAGIVVVSTPLSDTCRGYATSKLRHATVAEFMPALATFGDDQNLENHISPFCHIIDSDIAKHLDAAMKAQGEI